MAELGVPGVAFGVVNGGSRTTCTSGVTNVLSGELVDANTMFRVAALTNLFTGSAVSSLSDEGVIDLNAPVREYLPAFRVQDEEASEHVLVRHLLTHTAGWHDSLAPSPISRTGSPVDYVERLGDLPQVSRPGEHFSYNESACVLTGHLVSEITGMPYDAAVRDLALAPLSMNHSSFLVSDVARESMAFGHTVQGASLAVIDPFDVDPATAPVNGLFSSVDEILAFIAFHASAPVGRAPTYMSEDAREQAHRSLGPGGSMGRFAIDAMGVNWMLADVGGAQVSMHAGSVAGQGSMLAVVPAHAFGVVVLTNASHGASLAQEMVFDAIDRFLGLRVPKREPVEVDAKDLQGFAGSYRFIDGPEMVVTRTGNRLRLDTFDGGNLVEGLSGALLFVEPSMAELGSGESTLLVDFVRDGNGEVRWIRHLGRLAAKDA